MKIMHKSSDDVNDLREFHEPREAGAVRSVITIVACPACRGCGWLRGRDSETVDCAACDATGEMTEDGALAWIDARRG